METNGQDKPPLGARLSTRDDKGRQEPFEVREGERERVRELARICTSRQISILLRGPDEPLSHNTICRHFANELAYGRANFIEKCATRLYDNVDKGKETSVLWALDRLGDPGQFVRRTEVSGPNGGPIQTVDTAALFDLTDEELDQLGRIASKLAAAAATAGEPDAVPDPTGPDTGGD
jgi:hypothetical protein